MGLWGTEMFSTESCKLESASCFLLAYVTNIKKQTAENWLPLKENVPDALWE